MFNPLSSKIFINEPPQTFTWQCWIDIYDVLEQYHSLTPLSTRYVKIYDIRKGKQDENGMKPKYNWHTVVIPHYFNKLKVLFMLILQIIVFIPKINTKSQNKSQHRKPPESGHHRCWRKMISFLYIWINFGEN